MNERLLVSSSSAVDGQHFEINTDTTYSERRPIKQVQYPSIPSANWTFFPVAASSILELLHMNLPLPKKNLTRMPPRRLQTRSQIPLFIAQKTDWSTITSSRCWTLMAAFRSTASTTPCSRTPSPFTEKLIIPQNFQRRLAQLSDVSFTCQLSVATMSEVEQCLQLKGR